MFTRRTFLERSLLASGLAPFLVSGCAGISPEQCHLSSWVPAPIRPSDKPIEISWSTEGGSRDSYTFLVNYFNDLKKGVKVTHEEIDGYSGLFNQLLQRQGSDVVSLDTVWIDSFAKNCLIMPLNFWTQDMRKRYFPRAWEVVTVDESVYAAPFRLDLGMLFFLKEKVPTPPATWDELVQKARRLLNEKEVQYGYIWQGGVGEKYSEVVYGEGLFCNYLEVLDAYGGMFDLNNLSTITSVQAQAALTAMCSWVDETSPQHISPKKVLEAHEDLSASLWNDRQTAFMRSWPYDYAGSNTTNYEIGGDFDVTYLPGRAPGQIGRSCLGGWCLAINAASQREKQNAAWVFIDWMMGASAQELTAEKNSWLVTYRDIYSKNSIHSYYPFFARMNIAEMIDHAIERPRTANYDVMSQKITGPLHQALQGKVSPAQALQAIREELETGKYK